ncbi:MAG: hypothetical protein IJK40_03610 [Clostridia bacterium]|nr:hypothetical protein [Clostridia bacterium]
MTVTTAEEMDRLLFGTLSDWCGALMRLQVRLPDPALDGGILCPACGVIHGRCHEAVYPLMYMAHRTADERYLDAARRLFDWGENMVCPDGGMMNDFKSPWKGVTAFAAVSLHDALVFHGGLLTEKERGRWENRLSAMGEWLYNNLTEASAAYINYYAAGAAAMALLGNYFGRDGYRDLARRLAGVCFRHVSDSGLMYGECRPHDARSKKGCLGIDHGYNAEESLPMLCRYAEALDPDALERCRAMFSAELSWMLPDGAWDDSTGTRAFKWTYWGSRIADGCQDALFRLGKTDPVFAEGAARNAALLRRCTHNGLLAGGPDYAAFGERICVHHTFCHAKAFAHALDGGVYDAPGVYLPADAPDPVRYTPETDTYRLACGPWRMTLTACDAKSRPGAQPSGGVVSLLWKQGAGPVIAAGMDEDVLLEPNNRQLPRFPQANRSSCPRLEAAADGKRYAQQFDKKASLTAQAAGEAVTVCVRTVPCTAAGEPLSSDACLVSYTLCADGLRIRGEIPPPLVSAVRFILPVAPETDVRISCGKLSSPPQRIFSLTPGFVRAEYVIAPETNGVFEIGIL